MNGLTGRGGAVSKELRRRPVSSNSFWVSAVLFHLLSLSEIRKRDRITLGSLLYCSEQLPMVVIFLSQHVGSIT